MPISNEPIFCYRNNNHADYRKHNSVSVKFRKIVSDILKYRVKMT